jgi:hypothetical protein
MEDSFNLLWATADEDKHKIDDIYHCNKEAGLSMGLLSKGVEWRMRGATGNV